MQTLMRLHRMGKLTDQQLIVAYKFARNPRAFSVAPSLYRVLQDLVIDDRPVAEVEAERGWPARSARAILGVVLNALVEIGGTHSEDEAEDPREILDYLTGSDPEDLVLAKREFGLTLAEAKVFQVLKARLGRVVSRDQIIRAAYYDRDEPNPRTLDVLICHARKKIKGSDYEIRTEPGVGFALVHHADPTGVLERLGDALEIYALHVELGYSLREAARMTGKAAGSTALRAVRRVEEARDDGPVDQAIDAAVAEIVRRREAHPPAVAI